MFASLRICGRFKPLGSTTLIINGRLSSLFGTQSCLQCKEPSQHQAKVESRAIKSSLYFSARSTDVFTVLTPSFDAEYLRSVADNLEAIKRTMTMRRLETANLADGEMKADIYKFAELTEKLNALKKKRSKLIQKLRKRSSAESAGKVVNSVLDSQYETTKDELAQIRTDFFAVEEKVVPFLLSIPAAVRSDTGDSVQIIDQFEGSPGAAKSAEQPQPKTLNYVRLGYINNIFHSSIVGPNAQFLIGEGAQAFYGVIDYLSDLFECAHFVPVSGLDIVKSAVVEAINMKEVRGDLFLIRDNHREDDDENQRLHLAGDSSLESLCAWLCKQPHLIKQQQQEQPLDCKFVQIGSSYGSSFSQTHSVRASVLTDSTRSDQSMEQLYSCWWKALTGLGLKCRSVRVDAGSLSAGEHARYELEVWLHSQRHFLPVGQVTHHASYLSQRFGLPRHQSRHLLSSSLDLVQLLKCLIEHYHDPATGKIHYPQCISNYFI